ncbi:MAG: hypothetical protein ABW104_02625 [Candidatus Thiodiazotropha sp. 6PLUC2]
MGDQERNKKASILKVIVWAAIALWVIFVVLVKLKFGFFGFEL